MSAHTETCVEVMQHWPNGDALFRSEGCPHEGESEVYMDQRRWARTRDCGAYFEIDFNCDCGEGECLVRIPRSLAVAARILA